MTRGRLRRGGLHEAEADAEYADQQQGRAPDNEYRGV